MMRHTQGGGSRPPTVDRFGLDCHLVVPIQRNFGGFFQDRVDSLFVERNTFHHTVGRQTPAPGNRTQVVSESHDMARALAVAHELFMFPAILRSEALHCRGPWRRNVAAATRKLNSELTPRLWFQRG